MAFTTAELLGSSSPVSARSPWSPTFIAGIFRKPSRLRGRVMLLTAAVMLFVWFALAFRRDALYYDDATVREYMETHLTNPFARPEPEYHRPGDFNANRLNATGPKHKPTFHLLMPAARNPDICKSMLTAAVLNYPPPTLLNYDGEEKLATQGVAGIKSTLRFLNSKNVADDDLIMITNSDTWFQLPAELLIHRYIEGGKMANLRLYETYGLADLQPGQNATEARLPKFTQKVLFGADKSCTPSFHGDPSCSFLPDSTLPKNTYGSSTKDVSVENTRPHFLASGNLIGRASNVRALFEQAEKMMGDNKISTTKSAQVILARIFAEQEIAREKQRHSSKSASDAWREWVAGKWSGASTPVKNTTAEELEALHAAEFGIGLDYDSSVFQIMENSENDVHYVRFDHADTVTTKKPTEGFVQQITLPDDLLRTTLPFVQNKDEDEPEAAKKSISDAAPHDLRWTDLNLATNLAVPGSQVPASLNFNHMTDLAHSWWHRMWYHPYARALLRRYMRSSQGYDASEASKEGGSRWWNLRGGKGGVWTDRDEWLEWNEICGEHNDEVFNDGQGRFGAEDGNEPVYNDFGMLIEDST